jgi:hypothetical protein
MKRIFEITISMVFILLSILAYWYLFAIADRKAVFLYEHLGSEPFDQMTVGRYWMAGLILSGCLAMIYFFAKLLMRLIYKELQLNKLKILIFSSCILFPATCVIMMNGKHPVMPLDIALSSAIALIIGLALGLNYVDLLFKKTKTTLITTIYAAGIVPILILFRVIELPAKGILNEKTALLIFLSVLISGFLWLSLANRFTRKFRIHMKDTLTAGFFAAYVVLPMIHYLIATPKGYPYISSSDNFFPDSYLLRIVNWISVTAIVILADKLRKRSDADIN